PRADELKLIRRRGPCLCEGFTRTSVSGPFLPRYASTARFGPSPSTFDASTRLFPGHLWRDGATLRVVHFREACVCVPVQRDGPVLPFAFLLGGNLRFDPDVQVYTRL